MSRGAIVALVISLGAILSFRGRIRRILIIAGIFVLIFLSFSPKSISDKIENTALGTYLRLNKGSSNRDIIWAFAADLIIKEPWAGYGVDAQKQVKWEYGGTEMYKYAGDAGFHNAFIDVAIQYGLISALLYVLIFYVPLNLVNNDLDKAVNAANIVFLISILFVTYNIGGVRIISSVGTIFIGYQYLLVKYAHYS